MKLRILLADDHALFRQALRMNLEVHSDFDVVAEVGDGRAVIAAVEDCHPDVVCMDVSMPGLSGVEATQQLLAAQPAVKVVAMSAHADLFWLAKMLNAGALAYVLKMSVGHDLPLAIRSVSRNQRYFSPELGVSRLAELTAYGLKLAPSPD